MKTFGLILTGLVLAAGSALAQPALTPEQQAYAPAAGAFDDMLSALQNSRQAAQRVSSLGALRDKNVEVRDAYQLSRNGEPGQLDLAYNNNRQAVEDLRRALVGNKSVDRALSRNQIPISNVVAADVRPDGRVVIYAYPQDRVPPG